MLLKNLPYPLRLCVEMLCYATLESAQTEKLKCGELAEKLRTFFPEALIREALSLLEKGGLVNDEAAAPWPLPPEWDVFVPPAMLHSQAHKTDSGELVQPVWNPQWLKGLERYIRAIARDELMRHPVESKKKEKEA